jgi:hypothetical protein
MPSKVIGKSTCYYTGEAVQSEFIENFFRLPPKRVVSLDGVKTLILFEIVCRYWHDYCEEIGHDPSTLNLTFNWVDPPQRKYPGGRTATVILGSLMLGGKGAIDIFFWIELCERNVPHEFSVFHGDGWQLDFCCAFPECDGFPHSDSCI